MPSRVEPSNDPSRPVIVHFRATGNAPILKQSFYKITATQKFQTVITFLRNQLGYGLQDPLFLYINSAFAPAPDEIVGNLFKCFGVEGNLIINYSITEAWG
ncbi:ubiquitin-like protein Atg12 [Gaertneriomyces semiglobifer]|nr:ubiquitin-like protein Atg12 [Gaertneriomyces semiglobifer]